MVKTRNIAFQLFNVRSKERHTVSWLFFHHFFQGFGLALVLIVANTQFLSAYPISSLPKVYILSGLLVMVSGRIYAYFEHHTDVRRLLPVSLLLIALMLGFFWLGEKAITTGLFAFLLLSFYQVFYLLANLEFWGLSALVFDVRQSKRLFGLISSGDMPAKMLGYLTVSLAAPFVPISFLIIVAALSILLSFLFLRRLIGEHRWDAKKTRDLHHQYESQALKTHPIGYLKKFFKNRFILVAAVLSFLVVITLAAINYSFLSEVKYKFKTDKELASFFGLFFAGGQFLTIGLKAFFSGRVLNWLGVKKGMLVLPVIIGLLLLTALITQGIHSDYKNLLYVYGFLMLVTEVLNYSLQQPLFLSLFQPLNEHLRLHGHTVIKGFVDGLGLVMAGTGILLLLNLGTSNQLLSFGLVILGLAIGWTLWVFIVEKGYHQLVMDAIRTRRFTGKDLHFQDDRILANIQEKIGNGKPWEILYRLELVKNNRPAQFTNIAAELLPNAPKEIRSWILGKLDSQHFEAHQGRYRELLSSSSGQKPDPVLLKRMAETDPQALDWAGAYLIHPDRSLVSACLTGLLKGKSIEGMVLAGSRLIELKDSKEPEDRILSCQLISDLKMTNFHQVLEKYLTDPDPSVFRKAVETASQLRIDPLFPVLMERFSELTHKSWFLNAMASYGEKTIHYISNHQEILLQDTRTLNAVLYLSRQIGGNISLPLLMKDPFLEESEKRGDVLSVLSETQHLVVSGDIKELAERWLAEEIQFLGFVLSTSSEAAGTLLHRILRLEEESVIRRIFGWLHVLYPGTGMPVTRDAYFSHYANKRANALEALDSRLSKRHKSVVFPLLEKVRDSRKQKYDHQERRSILLDFGLTHCSRWSIASMLEELSHTPDPKAAALTVKWQTNRWSIIQQQVFHSQKNRVEMTHHANQDESSLSILEKVSLLKGTELFSQTPENLLADVAEMVHPVRLDAGDRLFSQGDPGDAMFIVYSGAIDIMDGDKKLVSFSSLDFFGELSLLDDEPRSGDAIASEESLLLSISQEDFYELISFRTEVAKSILRVLSQRLRKQNKS